MNSYPKFKKSQKASTAIKSLLFFCALTFGLLAVFYPQKDTSATLTINTDCTSIPAGETVQPGVNCLFSSMNQNGSNLLPLCKSIPNTTYTINSANVLTTGVNRYSCTNLSDLPLCSLLGDEALPGKNCTLLCNSSFNDGSGGVAGADFAIHNRDCTRFCDAPESSAITIDSTNYSNCVNRKCHQFSDGTVPNPTGSSPNCTLLPCNLLTPHELIDVNYKINSDVSAGENINTASAKYCSQNSIDAKPLKCYHFNQWQLPYLIRGSMCEIHNCPPPCSNYKTSKDVNNDGVSGDTYDIDDTKNISDRNRDGITDSNTSYVETYKTYINGGAELSSTQYCSTTYCRPIVKKQFRCVKKSGDTSPTGDNSLDIQKNGNCDTDGDGSSCSNNFCYKTIDCNEVENNSEPECAIPKDGTVGSTADTVDSWFYRPKPMDISTVVNGSARVIEDMENGLCYKESQMEKRSDNSTDGKWGENLDIKIPKLEVGGITIIPAFTIPLGWFHGVIPPDQARSPGMCNVPNVGFRGTGYIYLCYGDGSSGSGQLYGKVSDQTAYHLGYVQTTFSATDAIHRLKVCLRFRNALMPDNGLSETCGARQCAISCMGFAGGCSSQNCGYDVCEELIIKDSNPDECKMSSNIFHDNPSKGCMKVIDTYLRLRVQKYGNRICSYLDVKGQTAYDSVNDLFMRGNEKLDDGTCAIGTADSSGNCSGYSSYSNPSEATKWRTIKFGSSGHIPYIKNNQIRNNGDPLDGVYGRGYMDKNGQFFKEQECIHVPLRVAPPKLYNLATIGNSVRLFTPPIYIKNAFTKAGSNIISPRDANEDHGSTSFIKPSIQVNFGNTTREINLGAGVNGYGSTRTIIELKTTVGLIDYSVDVFVRKEFNETSKKPTFCLYRKIIGIDGIEQNPEVIGCVNRKVPELDNSIARSIDPSIAPEKTVISLNPASTFDNSQINVRYLSGFGTNNIDNNCAAGSDDVCSSTLALNNANPSSPTCTSGVVDPLNLSLAPPELYSLCAQREECSKLNSECITNEINLQAAINSKSSTNSFLAIRDSCNDLILPMCNAKKGITASDNATITNTNPSGAAQDITRYGWFNEICLIGSEKTDSFDASLKLILAHKTIGGIKGKCLTIEGSIICPDGGKAPNCNCVLADKNTEIGSGQEIRLQTRREAGLCVDMPLPGICPAITYNAVSTLKSDPNYIYSSINPISSTGLLPQSYGSNILDINDVVHISHKLRSEAVTNGNAEFPLAVIGAENVGGMCKGFWKNKISSSSAVPIAPSRTCENNSGNASWSSIINNPCIRYSCEERTTTGAITADLDSSYQGGYASTESNDDKGFIDGFATWPTFTKTTDFPENVESLKCIPGFKAIDSSKTTSGDPERTYETKINGYSGGTLPTRICNQIGSWKSPINYCTRITCPAISPPNSPSTSSDWAKWYDAGGATFKKTDASRSLNGGISATGTCNNDLGFFSLGNSPTRTCDHFGNWSKVENACTTRCEAVTSDNAPGSNNGNATWGQADIPEGQSSIAGNFGSCLPGYVPYPYPALKNQYGVAYNFALGNITSYDYVGKTITPVSGNANFTNTIPLNITQDNRAASNPVKHCRAVSYDGVVTNTWAAANSSCINSCPSYNIDPRVGVGTTQHLVNNNIKTIRWPSGSFGKWYYISSQDADGNANENAPDFNGQDASNYRLGKTDQTYILARKCGTNGKWEDPIPQCATNGGIISGSNATYNTSTRESSRTVDVGAVVSATSCRDGYKAPLSGDQISNYTCSYKSGSANIDDIYFAYKSGSPCQIACNRPNNGQTFGNGSQYNGASGTAESLDHVITLACKSGYTTNGNPSPTMQCQTNGTYGNLQNDCVAYKGCPSVGIEAGDSAYELQNGISNYTKYNGKCTNEIRLYQVMYLVNRSDNPDTIPALSHDGQHTKTRTVQCENKKDNKTYKTTVTYTLVCRNGSRKIEFYSCSDKCPGEN